MEQLCSVFPIIEEGMKTNWSECESGILYCFNEVVNSLSFDAGRGVFFAAVSSAVLGVLKVSMLSSNKINSH